MTRFDRFFSPPRLLLTLALMAGCANQAEGERCNAENANDDCETGLVCKTSRDLGGNADICCPESGASESPECIPGGGTSSSTGTGSTTATGSTTSTGTTTASTTGAGGAGGAPTTTTTTGAGGAGGASTTAGTGGTGGAGGN